MKESMKRRDSVAQESGRKERGGSGRGRKVQSERNDKGDVLLNAIG